jgi:hypothetical protein
LPGDSRPDEPLIPALLLPGFFPSREHFLTCNFFIQAFPTL